MSYRVIVSNFDAAFRVVAANLGISVIPVEVGASYASLLGIRVIPLTDSWAQRSFAVCFQRFESLQPAAQRMVDHLVARAAAAAAVTSVTRCPRAFSPRPIPTTG